MSEPIFECSSSEAALEVNDFTDDDEAIYELQDAYEAQPSQGHVRKNYRSYKESKRKVKEIRKSRQPYLPVVAVPPDDQGTVKPTSRYDWKTRGGKDDRKRDKGRKEEVNMVSSSVMTEFGYMVTDEPAGNDETAPAEVDGDDLEIFLSSVPLGCAVIDTGCTSSVIGEKTAEDLAVYLSNRGVQGPESLVLPPVQFRGFNGARTTSRQGLRWLVKIGDLWGHITTYVIPGATPFLLSRKVLQGMEARLDMGSLTLTSLKRGIKEWKLAQASDGHLLLPSFRRSPRDALRLRRPMRLRRQTAAQATTGGAAKAPE